MGTLQALKHVASAVRHAEILSDEAEDLGELDTARKLRAHGERLATELEDAVAAYDLVSPMRVARLRAHARLDAAYAEITVRLAERLGPDDLSRLSPGGYLDVVERARYRARRLVRETNVTLQPVADLLNAAVAAYDDAVDAYLIACADAQGKKDRAIVRSQALRAQLEAVKAQLLVQLEVGSDAWARVKRRAVRTKRAGWLDDARAKRLLTDVSEPGSPPVATSPG